ncbi:MAG: O-antigen ligase family protein [Acidobacteriota bacterium]
MPPQIATVVFALGILGLFMLDRDRKSQVSPALWIPVAWVSIGASRMVSQWLGLAPILESPDQYLEGSPLDRLILSGLLVAGLLILAARGRRSGAFLRANGPLLLFFFFAAISVLWSDYPFVAFKRWTKALGNLVMVLVVLTEPNPSAAVKRLLARSAFLLIPLSVLLVKYYPQLGRAYHQWTWEPFYHGVATTKNGLGLICLVFGLGSLWRFVEAFHSRERPHLAGSLIAHGAVLAMALWLLEMANSVTALACFLIGGGLMVVTNLAGLARKSAAVHILVVGIISVSLFGLFLDPDAGLVQAAGRDSTLTGRTALWAQLLEMNIDPWFGTGFESFWLGERAEHFWGLYYWRPNQAHNGYLEVFLNLGWIGAALLGLVMAWGYRNVVGSLRRDPELGRLRLAFFVVAVLYNFTESAFKVMSPVWITFLLAITLIPSPPRREEG